MARTSRLGLFLGLAFLIALTSTFVFAYRAGRNAHQFHVADEPIRPWMSIPFIAHTRHVPADGLFQAIGLPAEPHDRRSLRHLARDLKRPEHALVAQVQQAVNAARHATGSPAR